MNEREMSGALAGVAPYALMAGVAYAYLIHYLERSVKAEGLTWLEVVAGVGLTLALAVPVVGWMPTLAVVALFTLTGTPQIVGALYRHHLARMQARKALLEDVDGNPEEALTARGQQRGGSGGSEGPSGQPPA